MERWSLVLVFLSLVSLVPLFFIDEDKYYIPKFASLVFLLLLILYNGVYICECAGSFFKSCKSWKEEKGGKKQSTTISDAARRALSMTD